MADGRINIDTKIDEKGLSSSLNRIAKKIQSFGNSPSLKALSNIGNSITGVASGYKIVTDSIKMATAAVKEMSEAYNSQKTAETALTQAAKNNPYLLSENVKHLKDYASELQSISTYGDEELLPFMAQLASAGRTEQEIMDIMSASINVASSGSMSLDGAVKNLNKTFSGLSGELGEINPQVKALSAEQLKNGDAVKVLAKQYDGMAQEVAKATGSSEQLHNAIGDLKEEIGAPFEKAMSPIRAFFTELISGWAESKRAKREYYEAEKATETKTQTASQEELIIKKEESRLTKLQSDFDQYQKLIDGYTGDLKTSTKEFRNAYNDYQLVVGSVTPEEYIEKALKPYIKVLDEQKEKIEALKTEYNELKAAEAAAAAALTAQEREDEATKYINANTKALQEQIKAMQLKADVTGEEVDAGELYNAYLQSYIDLIAKSNGLVPESNQAAKDRLATLLELAEAAKTAAPAATDADDYAKASNKKLQESLNALEVEARAKGEAVSAQDKYNVYLQSYIDLLTETEGLIKEGYPVEQKRLEQLQEAKKALDEATDAESKLAAAIKLTQEVTETINGIKREMTTVEVLQKEIDGIETLKAQIKSMSDEEIAAAQAGAEAQLSKSELINGLNEAEKQAYDEKVDAITEKETSWWDKHAQKQQEILDLKKEIDKSEVLSAAEKYERMTELDEAYSQSRKQQAADMATEIKGYTDQAVSIMQDAANLALDVVKNQATAEQAELEKKYRNGEIGEDEYNEKLTEIKNKAAKEQYKLEMWQWSASLLQATANIAQGISQAIAKDGVEGIIAGALVAAAGGVQIASIIASKPTPPPSFSTGGIVGGSSYSGDNIAANLNSREMIMNMGQQKALWDFLNGGANGGGNGTNIIINNSASNIATAQPQISKDKIEIMIDARVNDSMKRGRYNSSLNMAQQGMSGDYYGI